MLPLLFISASRQKPLCVPVQFSRSPGLLIRIFFPAPLFALFTVTFLPPFSRHTSAVTGGTCPALTDFPAQAFPSETIFYPRFCIPLSHRKFSVAPLSDILFSSPGFLLYFRLSQPCFSVKDSPSDFRNLYKPFRRTVFHIQKRIFHL